MRKTAIVLLVGALAALAGWFYATPYLVVNDIRQAAADRDAAALSAHVDYPRLRENVKADLQGQVGASLGQGQEENPLAVLGAVIAGKIIGSAVDVLVTPDTIAAVLQGRPADQAVPPGEPGDTGSSPASDSPEQVDYQLGYRDFDTFVVTIVSQDTSTTEVILERYGLTNWKITDLNLPR